MPSQQQQRQLPAPFSIQQQVAHQHNLRHHFNLSAHLQCRQAMLPLKVAQLAVPNAVLAGACTAHVLQFDTRLMCVNKMLWAACSTWARYTEAGRQ